MSSATPRPVVLACVLALLLGACTTRGTPFDADSLPRIRPGVTTQQDVRRMFGAPTRVSMRASGGSEWDYLHEERKQQSTRTISRIGAFIASLLGRRVIFPPVDLSYSTTTRHLLRVFFDEEGVVKDYEYSRTEVPTRDIR